MATGWTTTGSLADSLDDVRSSARIVREFKGVMPQLVDKGLLTYTRTEGKAKLYQINKESNLVKELQKISRQSDIEYAEKISQPEPDTNHTIHTTPTP